MSTMENVAGTQSYNEKFDEIYKKLGFEYNSIWE